MTEEVNEEGPAEAGAAEAADCHLLPLRPSLEELIQTSHP
jgi:hypothetical protein